MSRNTPTLTALLVRNLLVVAFLTAAAALFVGTSGIGATHGLNTNAEQGQAESIRPVAPGSPEALLDAHATTCWTGNQRPLADVPTHAIVVLPGGHPVYTARPTVVHDAFAEALQLTDAPLDVIALCL
jgi:hypothetical protein